MRKTLQQAAYMALTWAAIMAALTAVVYVV